MDSPYGQLTLIGSAKGLTAFLWEVARQIGKPAAVRAVVAANGRHPNSISCVYFFACSGNWSQSFIFGLASCSGKPINKNEPVPFLLEKKLKQKAHVSHPG